MVYDRVGDLSQIARHALCEARHFPKSLRVPPDAPRRMPVVAARRAARQARASQLPCVCPGGGVFRWLSHVCGHVSATLSPQLSPCPPTHPYCPILGNPASRRSDLDATLTCPTLLLSSFPPRPSSLLSVQDDEEGVFELTQVIVLHRPESSSVISSPPCLRTTRWRLLPSQGHRNKNYTNNDAIHDRSRRPRAVNAILPAM